MLTLVRDRRAHLINLVHGLNAQQEPPDELVIACMQPEIEPDLPATEFPVRQLRVSGRDLPLARARNEAAAHAAHEGLVFLDVDCIPSPSLVARYEQALARDPALYMGEVSYLPAGAVRLQATGEIDFARLETLAQAHPARPVFNNDGLENEPDPGQLWGLSFALRRADHERAGGFDESYEGYGGEETDYAWRLAAAGVPFYWVGGARAWHQHHPLYRPPYPHFDAIISNARRFHARWRRWCMEYWLGMFRDAGLIEWSPVASEIRVLRQPSMQEIDQARLNDDVCFG
ncbi:sugar transferase [Salinisphaera dokdonensis CL-ES53]|uniref:Sugar transferase n=1 Tax=Salinisphaera dokdonensis CL-ES53 TaxID=1304272 RepID=A0ABV2B244_9GAMM